MYFITLAHFKQVDAELIIKFPIHQKLLSQQLWKTVGFYSLVSSFRILNNVYFGKRPTLHWDHVSTVGVSLTCEIHFPNHLFLLITIDFLSIDYFPTCFSGTLPGQSYFYSLLMYLLHLKVWHLELVFVICPCTVFHSVPRLETALDLLLKQDLLKVNYKWELLGPAWIFVKWGVGNSG